MMFALGSRVVPLIKGLDGWQKYGSRKSGLGSLTEKKLASPRGQNLSLSITLIDGHLENRHYKKSKSIDPIIPSIVIVPRILFVFTENFKNYGLDDRPRGR